MENNAEQNELNIQEMTLQIGNMNVELCYSDTILTIKIEEQERSLLKLISLQDKKDAVKFIVWDKEDGLLVYTIEPVDK